MTIVPARNDQFAFTLAAMMQTRSLAFGALATFVTACGGSNPEPSTPSLLSSSSYSSAPSSFSGPSSPSIPSHETRGDLVVRPDLACVPFVLRLDGPDAQAVLATLEKATQAIQDRFVTATKGSATMTMLGAHVASARSYSKIKSDEPPKFVVTIDGSVEVPLATDMNYWARARIVSSLVQASSDQKPLIPPPPEDQPQLDAAFGAPELKVKNPESYRAELVKHWVDRTRAFAKAAESDKAPLNLVNCDPPQAITQTPISIEQVGLSLAVSCHVDVARMTP